MSEYTLYLILALTFSVSINLFLFWFARKSSTRLTIVASNIDEIMDAIESFESHIEALHEMETFYGDETLHSVLMHARGVVEFLSEFEDIYELSSKPPEETDEEKEEVNDREEGYSATGSTQEEEKKTTKKAVFHAGT